MTRPQLPSPRSLSSLNISMFRMERIYLTFTVMISSFQNKEECAILNLDSRNPGTGRPCVQKFIASVPVYAHEAQSAAPGAVGAFGCQNYPLADLFLNFNSFLSIKIILHESFPCFQRKSIKRKPQGKRHFLGLKKKRACSRDGAAIQNPFQEAIGRGQAM